MWNSTVRSDIDVCRLYAPRIQTDKGFDGPGAQKVQSPAGQVGRLDRALDDGLLAAMPRDHLGQQLLAQIDLRLGVVGEVALVAHDFEPEMIERAAHVVELVLGLDDDL